MDFNADNLRRLIDQLRRLGFWSRLFSWGKIRNQLTDALGDLQKLEANAAHQQESLNRLRPENQNLSTHLQIARENIIRQEAALSSKDEKNNRLIAENKQLAEELAAGNQSLVTLSARKTELDIALAEQKKELQSVQQELSELKKQNTQLVKEEEFRRQEHSGNMVSLNRVREQIQQERNKEVEERNTAAIERLQALKATWSRHEEDVMSRIRSICQKHTVEYVPKAPFKGDPDNTLKICDEYVVLDAKSPAGDNLDNFPHYLKDQAEKAIKYARQENVRSDIFFVVPSNTLACLSVFVYRLGSHNVYIISLDALEPVILCLKKIEEYEFAEQLSPEERENICRVLGKFAHLSKRRIQVDSFFAKQFIELAYRCEADLPQDILESVMEFEKAEKLNPPQEKRAKAIPISEIETDFRKIKNEADGRGINMQDESLSERLNELPLYKKA